MVRPRRSGYKTQEQIRDLLLSAKERGTERLDFKTIVAHLNGDKHKASRNLKDMAEMGLVERKREGRNVYYLLRKYELTKTEKEEFLRRLKKAPSWLDTVDGKEWTRHIEKIYGKHYIEYDNDDERCKDWVKYQQEISEICKCNLNSKNMLIDELIAYAKVHRELKVLFKQLSCF